MRALARPNLRVAFVALVLIAFGVELYTFRGPIGDAFTSIVRIRPWWAAVAVAAALVSMGGFARTQRRMLHAGGADVSAPRMIGLVYTANAINWTFPGGTALSAGYVFKRLRGWGAPSAAITFALTASGLLSSLTLVALGLTYAVASGGSVLSAVLGGAGALALLAATVFTWRRPDIASAAVVRLLRVGNAVLRRDRTRGTHAVTRFVSDLTAITPRRRDWAAGTAFATTNWIADFGCLVASCRAVGLDHVGTLLLGGAFVAGMTASSVSLVPGGFGVIDVAMVVALSAGGVDASGATAGVVLYRLISCALLVVAGWAIWAFGRLTARRARVMLSVA